MDCITKNFDIFRKYHKISVVCRHCQKEWFTNECYLTIGDEILLANHLVKAHFIKSNRLKDA